MSYLRLKICVIPVLFVCFCRFEGEYPLENFEVDSLRLLTYNVLASTESLEIRLPELLKIIAATDADIIALQEAAPWFVDGLLKADWHYRYYKSEVSEDFNDYRGVYLLSKFPMRVEYHRLPGWQWRKFMTARMLLNGRQVTFLNIHLESPLDDNWIRAMQLRFVQSYARDADEIIMAGDFNFGENEQPETNVMPLEFKDAWLSLRPGQNGFTWDMEENPLALKNAYPDEASRRLDRILIKSENFRPCKVEIVGNARIAPDLTPSDHYGLLATFQKNCN